MTQGSSIEPGMCVLANGRMKPYLVRQLGMGEKGCAYRGTTMCHCCPYAQRIALECDWNCAKCNEQWHCPCGQDGQEDRVDMVLGRGLG